MHVSSNSTNLAIERVKIEVTQLTNDCTAWGQTKYAACDIFGH